MQNEMRAVLKEFTYELKTDIVNEMKTLINGEFKEDLKTELINEMRTVINGEFKEELKTEFVSEMKTVINGEFKDELKTELRDEITEGFKNEIRNSEERIGLRLDGIDHRLSNVENDVTSIKLTIENEIKPNICKIAEGYALLEERLDREALEEREYRKRIDYRLAALANQN